jgi:hypothetical protein
MYRSGRPDTYATTRTGLQNLHCGGAEAPALPRPSSAAWLRTSRLRKKGLCHAERSEASLLTRSIHRRAILRSAQDDSAGSLFPQPARAFCAFQSGIYPIVIGRFKASTLVGETSSSAECRVWPRQLPGNRHFPRLAPVGGRLSYRSTGDFPHWDLRLHPLLPGAQSVRGRTARTRRAGSDSCCSRASLGRAGSHPGGAGGAAPERSLF